MKKNKLIAGAMGVMMLGAMVLPVHAADKTTDTNNLSVTYTEPQNFTLSIPSGEVNLVTTENINVGVSDVNILESKEIALKMTGGIDESGNIELTDSSQTNRKAKTSLSLSDGGSAIVKDDVFAKFTSDGKKTLYFGELTDKDGSATKAGSYTGTITFTATIQNKAITQ